MIKNPLRSNKYRSASVISIGYSILGGAELSVALLFSRIGVVVLKVACSRVVEVDIDVDGDVDSDGDVDRNVDVDLESPVAVAEPVTELGNAKIALAAVETVVETAALLLLVDAKAKARTAGVSWRLVKHSI